MQDAGNEADTRGESRYLGLKGEAQMRREGSCSDGVGKEKVIAEVEVRSEQKRNCREEVVHIVLICAPTHCSVRPRASEAVGGGRRPRPDLRARSRT